MNTDLPIEYFNIAVTEYVSKQREVAKQFISGCIELGSILVKYREELKKEWRWLEFVEAIGTNISQVNQQIRLFEYTKGMTNMEILESVVTNWYKLNLFLSLTDEQKVKLLEKEEEKENSSEWTVLPEMSSEEFKEQVFEIKRETSPESDVIWMQLDEISVMSWDKLKEVSGWSNPLFTNAKFAARSLRKSLWASEKTEPFLQAWVHIEQSLELIKTSEVPTTPEEKEQIKSLISEKISELSGMLSLFTS